MANDSFKVKKALNIEPNTTPNLSTDGDIGFNSTDSNLEVYTGGSVKKVLTNSQAQVVTAKDIDGGTASNTSRITLPKSDKATLDGLTRKEGTLVYATDQQKAFVDNGTSLVQVGSGSGGGGINYILNPDAEVNLDGWDEYADAAGTSPVDGTGGAPTLTITRTTSTPLRGDGSFLITKDAANRQGEGASYDFTIDDADKAKVMQLTFDYEIASGTYATGDLAMYIVDVSNGTVIQPSGYQVENVGIESVARLTFQTASNSTSYRLCFHVASTSASAYTVKFDNVQLGPQVVPMGAPVTDWAGTSTTVANLGTGSVVTNSSWWRRVGDSMQIIMKVTKDGSGGSGSGVVTFTIPTGYSIDTAKLPSTGTQALGYAMDAAAGTVGSVIYNSATTVNIYAISAGIGNFLGSAFTANKQLSLNFTVPIVGWSSSTVVSSSAATNVVCTTITRTASQTGINPNASQVKITLNATATDSVGAANLASNRIDIKVPGRYNINAVLGILGTNTLNVQYFLSVFKNGTLALYGSSAQPGTGVSFLVTAAGQLDLVTGDYLELYLYGAGNNSVSTLTSVADANGSGCRLTANLIQGPSQIAASEVISLVASRASSNQAIATSAATVLVWNSAAKDSHGMLNTSTGVITVPAPGDYRTQVNTYFTGCANESFTISIRKNSTIVASYFATASVPDFCFPISYTVPNCVAGDTIDVVMDSAADTSYSLVAGVLSTIAVNRLGGVM